MSFEAKRVKTLETMNFAFNIVAKYAVVALKDTPNPGPKRNSHIRHLKENVYTIIESTTHSLAVDIVLRDINAVGTEYDNNSNGSLSRSSHAILPTGLFTSVTASGSNWFINNGLTDFSQQLSLFSQGSSKTYIPHQQQSYPSIPIHYIRHPSDAVTPMSATATSSPFDYGSNPAPLARKTLLCVDSRRVLREGISKPRRAKKMRWLSRAVHPGPWSTEDDELTLVTNSADEPLRYAHFIVHLQLDIFSSTWLCSTVVETLSWYHPFQTVCSGSFSRGNITSVSYNYTTNTTISIHIIADGFIIEERLCQNLLLD
ncbi:vacuolar protein sorting/targeting protein PEP1 [Stygiomarasmius scandens]|uniref:Vacuolar protein sorting/targeting protein PEP1 n=1 Tax=Marasmiellus scandens TaxID=2682957 RepID=A0ABR1IPR0_9AGAR